MTPITLASLSPITHQLHLTNRGGHRLLVVAFAGEYRPGSAGTPDATVMTAIVAGALVAWSVDGVVLDLRELDYAWGNGLLAVFRPPQGNIDPLSWAVVVSGRCEGAVRSLLGGSDAIFDELEAALDHAARAATAIAARSEALEGACLVILVADDVPEGERAERVAAVAVNAGLAVDEDGDMRSWSSGFTRTRVESAPRQLLASRRAGAVVAMKDAIAWMDLEADGGPRG